MSDPSGLLTPDKAELVARYSSEGQQLERQGEAKRAIERWGQALALLPRDAAQAVWIREHIASIERAHPEARPNGWVRRLGPLAPIAVFFAKFKFLFVALLKFKFLFSLFAFLGFYWAIYGFRFGLGFAALILIHEMGHYIDVKRRGLSAEMPVFLPGFGAYVRWRGLGVTAEAQAEISLAGPFAGLLASAACAAIWWTHGGSTGIPTRTGNLFSALASVGAWLNAVNLIPVYVLDGGQAVKALNRGGRAALMAIAIAIGYITGKWTFYLIAAGAAWSLYQAVKHQDEPEESSTKILACFTGLLAGLALLMFLLPGRGTLER